MLELSRDRMSAQIVRKPLPHDSAARHVSGEALYVDDLPEPRDLVHIWVGLSTNASAQITAKDYSAILESPGVVAVIDSSSVPSENDCSPTVGDDPVFADGRVDFAGQVIFAVAAESELQARLASEKVCLKYQLEAPVLSMDLARAVDSYVQPSATVRRGEPEKALEHAPHRICGQICCGGQDHFYLEGHAAMAVPREGGEMLVYSSTQHPSEVQSLVARVLGQPLNSITVEVRRMGGGFGGKETQSAQWACIAAISARVTGRPAKIRLDRDIDMKATGKRHDFKFNYEVGFDGRGVIKAVVIDMASKCGYSADLSRPINDRALLHLDNAYFLENITATTHLCRTNTVSNTAFRGFGAPQAMLCMERIVDEIACYLKKDPLLIRNRNYYGKRTRNITPYGMKVSDFVLSELTEELVRSSDYKNRRDAIRRGNDPNAIVLRGIALTPVKFGISFTMTYYNQAGALVHVYTDGTVHLSHGGTEMGQGLFVKVAQVVAEVFSIPLESIQLAETNTSRVPNTLATAASSGSDINGKAAANAADKIKKRLTQVAAKISGVKYEEVLFKNGQVFAGRHSMSFKELVGEAHRARVQLSATGFYRTPKINWDRNVMVGRPFYYFGYGAAVSEVAVDRLTGEHRLLRVDILHDAGCSLNPAVDMGQIEGGFVQGAGWLTSEELWWDDQGNLRTHAPSTYKIPTSGDVPETFNVRIWERGRNVEDTIYRSKAVGEPPLMLGISVFNALTDAVSSLSGYSKLPKLDAPATPERVLMALQTMK